MQLKKSVYLIIVVILILSFVSSAQTVVVDQTNQQPQEPSFFDKYFSFLKSPIFWWIILGLLLFLALMVGIFFLVRWIVKFLKSQSNIFHKLRADRMKLARIQRRYPSKHWWKVDKNTPVRLVRNYNNKMEVSQPIAYHRGDYTTNEGNIMISLNLKNNKKWFIFPISDLLVIPDKDSVSITSRDSKGKPTKIDIDNLPRAKDIVQFNENEILLFAESVSNVGMFFVPVLRASNGKIIDFALPVYQSLREVVIGEFLFEQTDEFSKVAKKSIDLNPNLRYETKVQDATSSVDVPSGNRQ